MKGKEALKLAQDTILAHNGNNKSSFTMKMLYQVEAELNEKDEKLTKYKRAFEILKDYFDFSFDDECPDVLYHYFGDIVACNPEDIELLEELMNNA